MSRWLGSPVKFFAVQLALLAVAASGCDRVRQALPEPLAAPLSALLGDRPPAAPAAPSPPVAQAAAVQPPPSLAGVAAAPAPPAGPALVDSLAAAGSMAANRFAQPDAGRAAAAAPLATRAQRALSTLRQAGLTLPDGAVAEDGGRLVLHLDAADADRYPDELAAQWALGFATLAASGAGQLAIVTSIDGQPMVDMQAQAADVDQLAAGAIDTGEFFRRVTVRRLGPEPDRRSDLDAAVQAAAPAEQGPADPEAAAPAKAAAAPRAARLHPRAPLAVRPLQRASTGRAPR